MTQRLGEAFRRSGWSVARLYGRMLRPYGMPGGFWNALQPRSLNVWAKHSAEAVGQWRGCTWECFALTGCRAGFGMLYSRAVLTLGLSIPQKRLASGAVIHGNASPLRDAGRSMECFTAVQPQRRGEAFRRSGCQVSEQAFHPNRLILWYDWLVNDSKGVNDE